MKPATPVLLSTRVLDRLRWRMRYKHYSLRTEQVYVYWERFSILWSRHDRVMRHSREMGATDVEAFLAHLATDRRMSAFKRNHAMSATLFHHRGVPFIELPLLDGIHYRTPRRHISSKLTKFELARLL